MVLDKLDLRKFRKEDGGQEKEDGDFNERRYGRRLPLYPTGRPISNARIDLAL
jgi:hypothetical protein